MANSLANLGTRDQTHTGDVDIVGTSRSTSTPTIGAWEYSSGASPVSVDLSGVSSTGATGALGLQHAKTVAGIEATGAVGSFGSPAHAMGIAGIEATGAVGIFGIPVPMLSAATVISITDTTATPRVTVTVY